MFADTDQLSVVGGVENLELLGVERSVGSELELHEVLFLKVDDEIFVFAAHSVEYIGVYRDA